jgi:hypothetical protein
VGRLRAAAASGRSPSDPASVFRRWVDRFRGALSLDDPRVVAGDGDLVLLATARELVAVAAGDPGRPFWRIYLRRDGHLWCLRA